MNRNISSSSRKTSFWRDEAGWPRDDPAGKYVFFGRAILQVGRSMFPESWTDLDPKLAFLNSNADRDVILRAVERVKKVSEFLGTAIAREDVYFALRPIEQGTFKIPASDAVEIGWITFGAQDWNIDDYAERFMYGKMADGRRGHPLAGVSADDWIFIEHSSLSRLIASLVAIQRPKDSAEADKIRNRAIQLYEENSPISQREFEKACREIGISSTISRQVHKELRSGR